MDDECYEDADFLPDIDADETAFYDGPTGEEGKPYMALTPPRWLREPEPAPEPVWDRPLLTPEEFMAKYGLKG